MRFSSSAPARTGRLHLLYLSAILMLVLSTRDYNAAPARSAQLSSEHAGGKAAPLQRGAALPALIAVETRGQLGEMLERRGFRSGAELGVQAGHFAAQTLRGWPSCTRYVLVDLWAQQENYKDLANVDSTTQQKFLDEAKAQTAPWENATEFLRMSTVEAAAHVADASLDYVYVDARHDYCGVKEDIETWWPKLRRGGVMAGHDYHSADAQILKDSNQDWSVCMDGSVHPGAVRGAVDEWAVAVGAAVAVTYREPDWPSWMMRKDTD